MMKLKESDLKPSPRKNTVAVCALMLLVSLVWVIEVGMYLIMYLPIHE